MTTVISVQDARRKIASKEAEVRSALFQSAADAVARMIENRSIGTGIQVPPNAYVYADAVCKAYARAGWDASFRDGEILLSLPPEVQEG